MQMRAQEMEMQAQAKAREIEMNAQAKEQDHALNLTSKRMSAELDADAMVTKHTLNAAGQQQAFEQKQKEAQAKQAEKADEKKEKAETAKSFEKVMQKVVNDMTAMISKSNEQNAKMIATAVQNKPRKVAVVRDKDGRAVNYEVN